MQARLEAPTTEFASVPKRRLGPPFRAPEAQGASFVELFFDLVFVFAVTQVTAQTVEHLDWEGAARALLIFWMIWWAWTQWTWALNPADTEHAGVRATTLVATAVAFVMAASVGQAFERAGGVWFGASYVAVRTMGLWLYLAVASDHKEEFATVQRFALASVPGMVAFVAGGFAGDEARAWFWLAGVVLDIGAAMLAGSQADWRLHAGHFAERHGLFVIIALGESLIVVGTIAAGAEKTADLVSVSIGAIAVACLLWWTYFGWLKDALERRFENEPSASLGQFARDTFSLLHFPLIGGVIGIAIGFEEMVRHPDHHLETAGMVALAGGLVLFVGAAVAVWARATRQLLAPRLVILTVLAVALALAADAQPALVLTIIAVALVAIVAVEEARTPGREAPNVDVTAGQPSP